MTIVFKVSDNVKSKMVKYYEDLKKDKTPPYAVFSAQEADTVVTLYESGKVMFQGVSADIDAALWVEQERILNNRHIDLDNKKEKKEKKEDKKDKNEFFYNMNTIGSDEVGTGDYFGPVVVSATYVEKKDFTFLEELGVKDSKKLTDENIIKIAPEIIKVIPHVTIFLDNKVYNDNYSVDVNMNKIKAVLHNKVLLNLLKKEKYDYQKIVVDQFVNEKKYYEYIKDVPERVNNITFVTKAEDKCLSVACAAIISRFIFLKEMKRLSEELGIELPKGAGPLVDEIGKKIIEKHGLDKLKDIAKLNFKNTERIKELS